MEKFDFENQKPKVEFTKVEYFFENAKKLAGYHEDENIRKELTEKIDNFFQGINTEDVQNTGISEDVFSDIKIKVMDLLNNNVVSAIRDKFEKRNPDADSSLN